MSILLKAKQVFETQIKSLNNICENIDYNFKDAVDLILQTKGKVIVTGMGKSGHIGKKIAATFSSTGTSSFFVHPAEAFHGDLGMIIDDDLVIALSKSGETDEY